MKVQRLENKNPNSFNGLYNNKYFLSGLEKISDHSASFGVATSFLMATVIRPLAINLTPDVNKENKKYATANSICSGISKFIIAESIILPVEGAIKKIDFNPEKFLKKETVEAFKNEAGVITKSRAYKFATQILKQAANFFSALPKSMLTIALIPLILDKIFNKKENENNTKDASCAKLNINFGDFYNKVTNSNLAFEGGKYDLQNKLPKLLGKVLDNKKFQSFAQNFQTKDTDIVKHMQALTDIFLCSSFALQTSKSKKIENNRKKALIYNNTISTALSLLFGYSIDNIVKSKADKFVKDFAAKNANNPKLNKYIEGMNVLRPTIVFAVVYYAILPVISTYLADKIDNLTNKEAK